MTATAPRGPTRWSPATLLVAAIALGVAGGAVEAGAHAVRHYGLGLILAFGPDFAWMTPLGAVLVLLATALPLLLLSALVPALRAPRVVVAALGAVAAFGPLLIAEQVHKAAAAVLAIGIGVALSRSADSARFATLLRRGALVGLVAIAVTGVTMVGLRQQDRAPDAPPPANRPNIVLLVLDTVRSWDIGWMGYWRPTTPKLNAWVARGLVFDRMLAAAPWTIPSHASMFTGHWPTELSASWTTPLDGAVPTIAELLSAQGYATAGFVGNYRYAGSSSGLHRGFGRYDDYPVTLEQVLRSAQVTTRALGLPGVTEALGSRRLIEGGADAGTVNRHFFRWLDRRGDRPFFAFLNYFDAHAPYLAPAPWDSLFLRGQDRERSSRGWARLGQVFGFPYFPEDFLRETRDAYDGSIAYLDFQVDSLLTELDRRGLLANTVVIITSDHGEHFGEHGLIQHGSSLYLPLLHVPFAMVGKDVPANVRIADATSLRHVAATLLDVAGATDPRVPGSSLLAYARNPGLVRGDTLHSAVDYDPLLPAWPPNQPVLSGDLRSVVLDSLQLIRNGDGREELYQLGRDPWQVRNLAGDPAFGEALARYRGALGRLAPPPER